MKEIKFRAYIKKSKQLVQVKSIHLGTKKIMVGYSKSKNNYGNYTISFDEIELMQYTGLKDKNGKEIYEGDKVYIIPEDEYGEVEWDNETTRYVVIYDNVITDFDNWYGKDLEVVGTIYD